MLMLFLRLNLKDKSGKQHWLPFIGWDNFQKEGTSEKDALKYRIEAPLYTLYWGFEKILCKACLLFNCFVVIKVILKALFSFIPWLLNFSDLLNHDSISRKIYTLRLLPNCLVRSTVLHIGSKVPPNPSVPSLIPLDGLLLA